MIESFKHKGLRLLFEDDNRSKLTADMVEKIRILLFAIDQATDIEDLNRVSFRLHPLKGDLKGFWSVTVRANWRIIFRFEDGKAFDLDLIDYH